MKRLLCVLLGIFFVLNTFIIGGIFSQPADAAVPSVRIAFVFDGKSPANDYFLENFKKSITKSMGKGRKVEYPANLVFVGDWTENGVKVQCNKAMNSNATTVVALGYIASKYFSAVKSKSKMIVTIDQYGLRDFGSGFFSQVDQFAQKLESFHRITNYKKVAIMMNDSYYAMEKDWNKFIKNKLKDKSINFVVVPVGNDVTAAMAKVPSDVDAAFILPQFKLTIEQLELMFNQMADRKIMTFSALGESDVKLGCMMGSGALDLDRKISDATSFNILSVLDGNKVPTQKVMFMEDSIMFVNMDTCEKVGFQPQLRLLNASKVITKKQAPVFDLSAVFNKLDEQNLDIEQKSHLVKAASRAALSAKLRYLPTVSVNLGYQMYDNTYASSAALLIPEKTGVFGVGIDQVIYSPALVTNILIKSKKVKFEKAEYKMTEQNMGIDLANLYIDTLMLRNQIGVQQEYVQEARENLAIARVREKMGFCGKEEVMRWASQLNISEQRLLDMTADYKNVKIAISKFLNNMDTPKNFNFELKPLTAMDPAFYTSELNVIDYVRTPQALEAFTAMLVDEAYNVSPELEKLKWAIKMKKNERSMYVQKFILPDAKLSYQYQTLMGREWGKDAANLNIPAGVIAPVPLNLPLNYDPLRASSSYSRFGIYAQWKPFEGGSKFAEIARINEEIKELNAHEMSVKLTLQQKVRSVINKAIAAYFSIEKDYKATFAAKENYEKVKADYLANKAPITQLIDAQSTYFNSKLRAANSQNEFFKQLVWVQRAICSVNWTKADPSAKAWIEKVKTDLVAEKDFTL